MSKELEANTTLLHYCIVSKIGEGGMVKSIWRGIRSSIARLRSNSSANNSAKMKTNSTGSCARPGLRLRKAYENRDYMLRFLKIDPSVDALRDDPRFKDLMHRMRCQSDLECGGLTPLLFFVQHSPLWTRDRA